MATTLWRKQDNLSGRWTSPDPYGGSMTITDPQSFNRYTYVNNDPVNLIDPTGLALSDIGVYQTDNPGVAHELENEMVRRVRTIIKQSQQQQQQEIPPPAKIPSTIGQPYTPNGPGTPQQSTLPPGQRVDPAELGPAPPPPGGERVPNSRNPSQNCMSYGIYGAAGDFIWEEPMPSGNGIKVIFNRGTPNATGRHDLANQSGVTPANHPGLRGGLK